MISRGMFKSRNALAKVLKPGGGPGLGLVLEALGSLSRVTWATKSSMLLPGTGAPFLVRFLVVGSHPSRLVGLLEIIFNRARALVVTLLGKTSVTGAMMSSSSSSSSSSSPFSSSSWGYMAGGNENPARWSLWRSAVSSVSSFAALYLFASWVVSFRVCGDDKTSSNFLLSLVIFSTRGWVRAPPGRNGSSWASFFFFFLLLIFCVFLLFRPFLLVDEGSALLGCFWAVLKRPVNKSGSTRANFLIEGVEFSFFLSVPFLIADMSLSTMTDQPRQCRHYQRSHGTQKRS